MSSFFQADPEHFVLLWRFISAIGFCLGIIFFAVMKFPQFRRQQFQDSMGCGWTSSLIVFLGISLGFTYFAWQKTGKAFIQADLGQDKLTLSYILPQRQKELDPAEIDAVRLQYLGKQEYRVVIHTITGHTFPSVSHPRHQIGDMFDQFQQAMQPYSITFEK